MIRSHRVTHDGHAAKGLGLQTGRRGVIAETGKAAVLCGCLDYACGTKGCNDASVRHRSIFLSIVISSMKRACFLCGQESEEAELVGQSFLNFLKGSVALVRLFRTVSVLCLVNATAVVSRLCLQA